MENKKNDQRVCPSILWGAQSESNTWKQKGFQYADNQNPFMNSRDEKIRTSDPTPPRRVL